MDQHARVEHNLTLHPPTDEKVIAAFDAIRAAAKTLGHLIADAVPESREQSQALTDLEDCVAHAIGGIARNQVRTVAQITPGLLEHLHSFGVVQYLEAGKVGS